MVRLLSIAALAVAGVATAQVASPRLVPVPEQQRTDEQRAIAPEFAPAGMSNAVGTLLVYPALARRVFTHDRYITLESTLPARDRFLLGLRAAWLAHSGYLWAHRVAAARRAGLTDTELRRIAEGPDAPGWSAFDVTLLRAADELHIDSFISDATWQALSARYTLPQMIDTIDTIGETTMYAGVFNSLGLQIELGISDRVPTGIPVTVTARRTNLRVVGTPRIPPVDAPPGARGGGANVFRTSTGTRRPIARAAPSTHT